MKIQFASLLLSAAFLSACSTTTMTTADQTLEQRLKAKYASADVNSQEPAPPAEGPEDTTGPDDVHKNPMLVPTPLLRYSAASATP